MEFTEPTWEARVAGQSAYELYNSAALFVFYLLRHDGAGDGSGVAAFLDTLRRELDRQRAEAAKSPFRQYTGAPMSGFAAKAAADFFRRGRSDEKLTAD